MVDFEQHRLHGPHHERQRDECQRNAHTPSGVLQVQTDRAVGSVESQQHQAGDNSRKRERQVNEDVDEALAREVVAYQHPCDQQAEEHIEDGDAR